MYRFWLSLALFPLLALAPAAHAAERDSATFWQMAMIRSVEYFNTHAWDEASGSYASDLAIDGRHTSETRYLVATGRMIYSLAHAAQGNAEYIRRAKKTADFLLNKMTATDAIGPYFLQNVDAAGKVVKPQNSLVVSEQAYGLCGLVALYQVTQDHAILEKIREMYYAFYRRFHDNKDLALFDGYDLKKHEAVKTKSFDSTVYVGTSFLIDFVHADQVNSHHANHLLMEIAEKVATHFPDPKTGWIHEQFTADWKPEVSGWRKQGAFSIGVVGHGFQAAWFLMRVADMTENVRSTGFRKTAAKIITSLLSKEVADNAHGGFYDAFKREDSALMWNTSKAWWQQTEAILALTLAERLNLVSSQKAWTARLKALEFFFKHFVDPAGGEFDTVDVRGNPVKDAIKGGPGKSAYHVVEFARYILMYQFPTECHDRVRFRIKNPAPGAVTPEAD
jgi:mannose/cellobiose epimerase-like protein (N-acyl-D-glucosamine 2-epimerase family)